LIHRRVHEDRADTEVRPYGNRTAADLIGEAASRLAVAGIETARLDAEVLLRHTLGVDRTRLFLVLQEPVAPGAVSTFEAFVERRLAGQPVAYITGAREFMGIDFAVGPGVLVPRPETELLVERGLAWLCGRPPALVVDVGTGSGAIVLSLAHLVDSGSSHHFVGSDRSSAALAFAIRNREALGLAGRVELVRGDLLTWLGRPADLILANLPYLTPEQVEGNPDLRAEPEMALLGGNDGLDMINRLLADAVPVLAHGGAMLLELDPSQAARVTGMAARVLPGARIETIADLAGRDRIVVIERP
jgi:release factor glutamine methyltransferase